MLARANPKAMEYFDLSSDGFWKSFWAIAAMAPAFLLWVFFNMHGQAVEIQEGVTISYPLLSETIFFLIALPFTAVVMVYFTKYMKISDHYASMVIVYNWTSAIVYLIMAVATVILLSGIISTQISSIILLLLRVYFGFYVFWFIFKTSLQVGGFLAFGVLLFIKLLDASVQVMIFKIFNPEYFNAIFNAINSLPS